MNLAPEIMIEASEIVKCPYTLRNKLKLKLRKIQSARVWNSLPVTLKSVNPLSFSIQKSKIEFLKTALVNFVNLTSNKSATFKLLSNV